MDVKNVLRTLRDELRLQVSENRVLRKIVSSDLTNSFRN